MIVETRGSRLKQSAGRLKLILHHCICIQSFRTSYRVYPDI